MVTQHLDLEIGQRDTTLQEDRGVLARVERVEIDGLGDEAREAFKLEAHLSLIRRAIKRDGSSGLTEADPISDRARGTKDGHGTTACVAVNHVQVDDVIS